MSQQQVITLKWGTLKGWDVADENSSALELLKRYHEIGACFSVAAQRDTPEQKQILIELVLLPDMQVYLDWDEKFVSQEEGAQYIKDYIKDSK